MKPFNFTYIDESAGSRRQDPPAGDYVVKIDHMEDVPTREYVWVVVDIAEGRYAGHYADAEWDSSHRLLWSYKDTAAGMLKHTLHILSDSNPGFDAEAAWNAGDPRVFAGRVFGIGIGREERRAKSGNTYERLDFFNSNMGTADDARAGKIAVPDFVPLDDDETPASGSTSTQSTVYDDEVPFD